MAAQNTTATLSLYRGPTVITLAEAEEFLKREDPAIWARVNTKFVDPIPGYAQPKELAVLVGSILVGGPRATVSLSYSANAIMLAHLLEKFDFPSYYVSRSLFDALCHTPPPSELKWQDVFFPFSAVNFMLPDGVLYDPIEKTPIRILTVAKVPSSYSASVRCGGGKLMDLKKPSDGRDYVLVGYGIGCGAAAQLSSFDSASALLPDPVYMDNATRKAYAEAGVSFVNQPSSEFTSTVCGVAAVLMLAMMARQELVEPGIKTTKVLKSGAVKHTPTWLGRKYVVQVRERSSKLTGAHFTELGWRGGCWRTQHHGLGNKDTKIILVDPYMAYMRKLVRPFSPE